MKGSDGEVFLLPTTLPLVKPERDERAEVKKHEAELTARSKQARRPKTQIQPEEEGDRRHRLASLGNGEAKRHLLCCCPVHLRCVRACRRIVRGWVDGSTVPMKMQRLLGPGPGLCYAY
ncbi:hypothetical protein EYF80_005422 [Liparis tanakae]|uniref:Uncharacterized protein n=1 Tax=Liparis tanakae TaxID=230148 RepID=A0A4Z2J2I3_9TELE|nr:hypothetical protein EYF80_005422 [Liparis tanakae]